MAPRTLILGLLFFSACAAPPPASRPDPDPRAVWKERTRAILPGWGRKELEAFVDGLRVNAPHTPAYVGGGGFSTDTIPLTHFNLFSLDETYALYVVWKTEDPAQGIRSTEVVGFPDLKSRIEPGLFEAVAAIHRSPSAQQGLGVDPVPLIRAVNALQALGKDGALKALRAYLDLPCSGDEAFKYQIDEYRILPIVQLLFESPRGRMEEFRLGAADVARPDPPHWPLFPLALVQDVPFMIVSGYILGGIPQDPADLLRRPPGPLRAAPLLPQVTALEAVDELIRSPGWDALGLEAGRAGPKRWQVRRQALAAVSSVFKLRPEESSNDCCVDPSEDQWRAAVARAKAAGIVWSPEIQDFILGR